MRLTACVFAALGLCSTLIQAQQPPAFPLTIPSIMRGSEVVGRAPENVRWSADGRWIYFSWLPPGTDWREAPRPYRVRALAGGAPEELPRARMDTVGPLIAEGPWNPSRTARVVESGGDLYLVPRNTGMVRRLTETFGAESEPHFSSDGRTVYYRQGDNGYAFRLSDGEVRQLTDIRPGPAPKEDSAATGQRGFLEAQQRELFASVRDRIREDSVQKAERKAHEARRVKPLYLGKEERIAEVVVSPNERVAYIETATKPSTDRETRIPNYVTRSGYTEDFSSRAKVGDAQGGIRTGIMLLPAGDIRWLNPIPNDSTHAPSVVQFLGWNDTGTAALLWAESADFKHRYLYRLSADTTRPLSLDVLNDSAWIGGPCATCGGWYDGGRRAWFVSEADGYAHVYSVAADGSDRRQLTSGTWEVEGVELSTDQRFFYLHTSEKSRYDLQLYRMPVTGGRRDLITTRDGGHSAVLSPDEAWLADVFSNQTVRPSCSWFATNQEHRWRSLPCLRQPSGWVFPGSSRRSL